MTRKKFQSFKAEIVCLVIKSLKTSQVSSKKRRVTDMDQFNLEEFRNLTVSSDSENNDQDNDSDEESTSS